MSLDDIQNRLKQLEKLISDGLDNSNAALALRLVGCASEKEEIADMLSAFKIWGDYMPVGKQDPYTEEQRNLHILWECLDRYPLGINCAFAIPLRQLIAKKLFKRCGEGFVANEGCRFNYGHRIEVGDNVSWNAGCYIDSKGGVSFGDFSMLTEYAKIFTHSHNEIDHLEREYGRVEIGGYAKVYTNATILPSVRLGKGAIVATGAVVTKSVDDFTLVAGVPARPMRMRKGTDVTLFNQYMMGDREFQK